MTKQQAIDFIHDNPEIFLTRAPKNSGGYPTYICPMDNCTSGTGKNGTGISTEDGIHYTCWACGQIQWNDIIDIIAIKNGINPTGPDGKTTQEALQKAFEVYGITVDNKGDYTYRGVSTPPAITKKREAEPRKPAEDYSKKVKELTTAENVQRALDYLSTRGISADTARRLGYTYNAQEKDSKGNIREALIIPVTREDGGKTYQARYLDKAPDEKGGANKSEWATGGGSGLFNLEALNQTNPVFICEGAIDATSIIELGYEAIGLNSKGLKNRAIEIIKRGCICNKFVVVPDNDADDPDRLQGLWDLADSLAKITTNGNQRIIATTLEVDSKYHDVNQWIINDREGLKMAIEEQIQAIEEQSNLERATIEAELQQYNLCNLISGFREYLNQAPEGIPTGFKKLDTEYLDGGLKHKKMYVIGGAPGYGKTTIALQMADNIASSGHPVILFSLEEPKEQVMAKSISRYTYILSTIEKRVTGLPKTETEILKSRCTELKEGARKLIEEAISEYESKEKSLKIIDADFTVEKIKEFVGRCKELLGLEPVVIIDYLQYARLENATDSDKRDTDTKVRIISTIKKELNVPVILLSQLSRGKYNNPDMDDLKESGIIEAEADVIMLIKRTKENLAQKNIELKVVKNRSGKVTPEDKGIKISTMNVEHNYLWEENSK